MQCVANCVLSWTRFGGGSDITPSYLDVDDIKHFHGTYKKVCDEHDPAWYPRMKEEACLVVFVCSSSPRRFVENVSSGNWRTGRCLEIFALQ